MAEITAEMVAGRVSNKHKPPAEKVKPFLASIGFLSKDPRPPDLPQNGTFAPTHAALLLTNRCQMRCIYCYAAGGELPPDQLSIESGKTAIDIVHQNAVEQGRSSFSLSFHGGGEPLMAWDVITACTAYARGKKLPAKIDITTNGIWSEEQGDWIIKHVDLVNLSMDGHPEIQDRNRPLADGSPSSAILMRTLKKLDANHKEYSIRMTVIEPWQDFSKSVTYICEHSKCKGIQVEPAFNSSRGHHANPNAEQADGFIKAYLLADAVARKHGKQFRYSGARAYHPFRVFCSAPFNSLVINPQNKIVACFEITNPDHELAQLSHLGMMDASGLKMSPGGRDNLLNVIEENRKKCSDCFCFWSCAGDCYTRTLTMKDGVYQKHTMRCRVNQALTKELLLQRIAAGNGVAHLFQGLTNG